MAAKGSMDFSCKAAGVMTECFTSFSKVDWRSRCDAI